MHKDLPTFNTPDQLWHGGAVPEYFVRHANLLAERMDEFPDPVGDMGEENPKIRILQQRHGFRFTSIEGIDFDTDPIPGTWGTLFCLEILEHLFNPLLALENMRRALRPDGILYLSTPGRPHYLWPDQHYHEIDDRRIDYLFRRAGWRIEQRHEIPLRRSLLWHLRGVRPMLRLFHHGTRLYKLRPDVPVRAAGAGGSLEHG